MNFQRLFLFFIFTLSFCGFALAQARIIENSGFVPGNIWFSKAPSSVGETVKIYTMVWNASKEDISGTVSFFDNDTLIEKQEFILAGEGSSKILSAPWKSKEGYHKIYAVITESFSSQRGSKVSEVSLEYSKTKEDEKFLKTPVPENSGATTTALNFVDQKIEYAKGYLESNLPKPAVDITKSTASETESIRGEVKGWSDERIASIKKKIDIKGKEAEKANGFDIKGPLSYVSLFLLSILSFITGNAWVFYGLLTVVIFFVLRFIKRKFFF
mgnify:CR=1 FL=1